MAPSCTHILCLYVFYISHFQSNCGILKLDGFLPLEPCSASFNGLMADSTERIRKIEKAFKSPVKFVEGTQISLTSGSPMTSQVTSKNKCFAVHGSRRECSITSCKTHFIENKR